MNNFYSESLKNIFFTFGNEYRLKIIDALFMKRLTMTKLAVELDSGNFHYSKLCRISITK